MELEINIICTELDGLLSDFLTRWAEDLGKERDAADLERLYCMYPRVVSQIASARASLWGADQLMVVARHLRVSPGPEVDLRAVHVGGGCGHPCSSGIGGVYVARSVDHGGGSDCGCRDRPDARGNDRTAEREVIRPSDRDYDREVERGDPRQTGRDGTRVDDRNSEESNDVRNADRFRA